MYMIIFPQHPIVNAHSRCSQILPPQMPEHEGWSELRNRLNPHHPGPWNDHLEGGVLPVKVTGAFVFGGRIECRVFHKTVVCEKDQKGP